MCRLSNRFRMRYRVDPGLYALGDPKESDPVFVSANYRLSFNILRSSLTGRNAWILVLDTKGINVWCAAGKGTFCTNEIVKQLSACNLTSIISHRTLILPQLSASGVSASKLQKACGGFSVKFGPVRASDIPAFLDNNCTVSPAMRRVRFSIVDRAKLVPMETIPRIRKSRALFTLCRCSIWHDTHRYYLPSSAIGCCASRHSGTDRSFHRHDPFAAAAAFHSGPVIFAQGIRYRPDWCNCNHFSVANLSKHAILDSIQPGFCARVQLVPGVFVHWQQHLYVTFGR